MQEISPLEFLKTRVHPASRGVSLRGAIVIVIFIFIVIVIVIVISHRHRHRVIVSSCHSCHRVIVSSCHHVIMSSCHHVIVSSCHRVIVSSCHHVIVSSCHRVIVSSCHRVIVSSCHRVIVYCHCLNSDGCGRTSFLSLLDDIEPKRKIKKPILVSKQALGTFIDFIKTN